MNRTPGNPFEKGTDFPPPPVGLLKQNHPVEEAIPLAVGVIGVGPPGFLEIRGQSHSQKPALPLLDHRTRKGKGLAFLFAAADLDDTAFPFVM